MESKKKLVVVGADDGPESERAFRRAVALFGTDNVEYVVACVRYDELTVGQMFGLTDHAEGVKHAKMVHNERVLDKFKAIAEELGVEIKAEDLLGDPRERLCRYCKQHNADVLVLGRRRHKWLVMGSVSSHCSQHATCPVLIDHGEEGSTVAAA